MPRHDMPSTWSSSLLADGEVPTHTNIWLYQGVISPALTLYHSEWPNQDTSFSGLPETSYATAGQLVQNSPTQPPRSSDYAQSCGAMDFGHMGGSYRIMNSTSSHMAPEGPVESMLSPEEMSSPDTSSIEIVDNDIASSRRSSSSSEPRASQAMLPQPRRSNKRLSATSPDALELLDCDSEREGVEQDGMLWGMKANDYRALNARERKRVRNRISARLFRAKRKGAFRTLK